jgi:hypothetical protein
MHKASIVGGRTVAMSAASVYALRHHHDDFLWKLVSASSVETKEVASEIPAKPTVWQLVQNGFSLTQATWRVRAGFHRLETKQGKVLQRLSVANFDAWGHDDCAELAVLLDELVRDEQEVLRTASQAPFFVQKIWGRDLLCGLGAQVVALEDYSHQLDALSVPVTEMPGDQAMSDFMLSLRSPEEYDFSVD